MTNIGAASDANYYIDRWLLTPEGNAIVTRTSHPLPVRHNAYAQVMLWKISNICITIPRSQFHKWF